MIWASLGISAATAASVVVGLLITKDIRCLWGLLALFLALSALTK